MSKASREGGFRFPLTKGTRIFALVVTLLFCVPLFQLFVYAAKSELNSYILLIPGLASYLVYLKRFDLQRKSERSLQWAIGFAGVGLGLLISGIVNRQVISDNDWFFFTTSSYLSLLVGGFFYFQGKTWLRTAAIPLIVLVFMIPLPDLAVLYIEKGLIWATAESLAPLLDLTGTPALREGQIFHIPGITIEIARECSGIRSTLVLFIAGTLAPCLFLRSTSHRAIVIASLIPLGIARNTFRILVIAMLCVHHGPEMIHGRIHQNGGPWFFVISLIPLFALLWWLCRRELRLGHRQMNQGHLEFG